MIWNIHFLRIMSHLPRAFLSLSDILAPTSRTTTTDNNLVWDRDIDIFSLILLACLPSHPILPKPATRNKLTSSQKDNKKGKYVRVGGGTRYTEFSPGQGALNLAGHQDAKFTSIPTHTNHNANLRATATA
jgi:hypothetical protein